MAEFALENLKEDQKQLAEVVGLENYLQLVRVFGGTTIYIAKTDELVRRNERDEKIRQEFDGTNARQLALKYGLSETWIRNIVSEKIEAIKKAPIPGQLNLEDFL